MTATNACLTRLLSTLLLVAWFAPPFHGSLSARPIPPLSGPVIDEADVLSRSERRGLEADLRDYAATSQNQIQVVIVRSLDGEPIESFSIRLGEEYKIGDRKRGSGVILVVSIGDRALRIEVGEGLEGVLPDIVAGRIIRDVIAPRFKAGDFAGGIRSGIDAIKRRLDGDGPQSADSLNDSSALAVDETGGRPQGVGGGAIIGLFMVMFFLLRLMALGWGPGVRRRGRRGVTSWHGGMGGIGTAGWGGFGGWSGGGRGWSGGGGGFSGGGASGRW